jgi:hypothetical protein
MFSLGTVITAIFLLSMIAIFILIIVSCTNLTLRYEWTKYIIIPIAVLFTLLIICIDIQYGDVPIHFPWENL